MRQALRRSAVRQHHEHTTKQRIVRERVKACTKCGLRESCQEPVPASYGRKTGGVLIIGEAPGQAEDRQGVPFIGQAGKLLLEIIDTVKMKRAWVGYCNSVACRPPRNRNPHKAEIDTCAGNLRMQISAIQPHVIVPMGAVPLSLFRPDMKISWDRGRPFVDMNRRAIVLPTFHPAYVLRQKSAEGLLRDDLAQVRDRFLKYAKYGFMDATYDWPEDCHKPNCKSPVDKYDGDGVAYCREHWTGGETKQMRETTLVGTV